MSTLKLLHIADLHIGTENYGTINIATGTHSRLTDFQRSLNFAIDYAIAHEVDAVLFSGDAYKTNYPTPTHQKILLSSFRPLFEHNIPLVMVVGNHDQAGNSAKAHALDVFHHFRHEQCFIFSTPGAKKVMTKNGPFQVVGIPWPSRTLLAAQELRNETETLSNILKKKIMAYISWYGQRLDNDIPAVLLGHLAVDTVTFSGSERPMANEKDPFFSFLDLSPHFFDYIALGHIHSHQIINKTGYPWGVYPGAIDRIDFGEKDDVKGFCMVELAKKTTTVQFIKNEMVRPFLEIMLTANDTKNYLKIFEAQAKQYSCANAIIKVKYSFPFEGDGAIPDNFFETIFKGAGYLCEAQRVKQESSSLLIPSRKWAQEGFSAQESIQNMVEQYCKDKEQYQKKIPLYLSIINDILFDPNSEIPPHGPVSTGNKK